LLRASRARHRGAGCARCRSVPTWSGVAAAGSSRTPPSSAAKQRRTQRRPTGNGGPATCEEEVLVAVAVEMDFRGATLDQYDQVIEKMGLTPGGGTPPGAISRWVAKTDDGLRVVDVWETREAFDRFAE